MRLRWIAYAGAAGLAGFLALFLFLAWGKLAILMPAGAIAASERSLMLNAILLMLIVIVPVYMLTFFFAWHYRASNTRAAYEPEWEHSKIDELVWWAIPIEIVLVLGALTWTSTHELDPRRAIASEVAPLTIQVVSLDWKWLFIYPEEQIASVNEVAIPTNRPIKFLITADAPMNSFWIPQLGGQIYAMPGMVNTLYLAAGQAGKYKGLGANYTGEGFARMKFTARALDPAQYEAWTAAARQSTSTLSAETYAEIAHPSVGYPVTYYGSVLPDIYKSIVAKYMSPDMAEHKH